MEAKELEIELMYLPSYSPQLNLIERFWKFTKRHCLQNMFYETFEAFKESIGTFIERASTNFKQALDDLLSWKFQTFEDVQILSV